MAHEPLQSVSEEELKVGQAREAVDSAICDYLVAAGVPEDAIADIDFSCVNESLDDLVDYTADEEAEA